MITEEKRLKRNAYHRAYSKTAKGIANRKKQQKKYHQRKRGITTRRAYQKTTKGKEMAAKHHDKRRRGLNRYPLNKWFENSEGHHINKNDIIYIPKS